MQRQPLGRRTRPSTLSPGCQIRPVRPERPDHPRFWTERTIWMLPLPLPRPAGHSPHPMRNAEARKRSRGRSLSRRLPEHWPPLKTTAQIHRPPKVRRQAAFQSRGRPEIPNCVSVWWLAAVRAARVAPARVLAVAGAPAPNATVTATAAIVRLWGKRMNECSRIHPRLTERDSSPDTRIMIPLRFSSTATFTGLGDRKGTERPTVPRAKSVPRRGAPIRRTGSGDSRRACLSRRCRWRRYPHEIVWLVVRGRLAPAAAAHSARAARIAKPVHDPVQACTGSPTGS